jgi:methyl-accepting chemotaxis protein PixJ
VATLVVLRSTRQQLRTFHNLLQKFARLGQDRFQMPPLSLADGNLQMGFTEVLRHLEEIADRHSRELEQRKLFNMLIFRSQHHPDEVTLLQMALDGVRQIIGCDRVILYRFDPNWSGKIVAESVATKALSIVGETITDSCFSTFSLNQYQQGRIRAIPDIYSEPGLAKCHIRLLEQYRVRANLIVPLRQNDELIGLLIAHDCTSPRLWSKADLDFMEQLAAQLGYRLDYINYVQAQEAASHQSWFFGEIAFRARQSLNLNDIFDTTVQGSREILQVDRVLMYRFHPDWSGTMIAEAVTEGWPRVLDENIEDPCFRGRFVELYRSGRVRAINNLREESGLSDCHIRTLERYGVKANLVVPIRQNYELIGLLIAHHCVGPRTWQQSEINFFSQLATQVEYALDHLSFIKAIQATAAQARLYGEIAFRARQSLNPTYILRLVVQGARKIVGVDRVAVLRFNRDWSGTIVMESVSHDYSSILHEKLEDPCFQERYVDLYRKGRVRAINDIYQEPGLTECHIGVLERYDIRANLLAPIRRDNQLFGLLIANQCSGPRLWQKSEIDFFYELVTQAGYALDHIGFIGKLEKAKQTAEVASQEQRQQKEAIERQVEDLLQDVQGAGAGDLTARTRVMNGEIGAVAAFVNATIEHLQHLVLHVQSAAELVTQTANSSATDVQSLSAESVIQAQAITLALGQIQGMADSIQGVAANAQQAELKVQQANQILQEGDEAMNRTVDGILAIQATVEEAAHKVKRLGEASQRISHVLNLIRDLASQTNVLALNASIEAKGSAQEGQVFAVVAEEVRSLAEQSTLATKEIEQIIEDIQAETRQVVTAMELGREQVITGTVLVETTRQNLNSIATVSAQIRTLVEAMTQAATAQAQTSTAISKTMQDIEEMTQNTSVRSIAVSESFTKLLGVAKELQDRVTQFRV